MNPALSGERAGQVTMKVIPVPEASFGTGLRFYFENKIQKLKGGLTVTGRTLMRGPTDGDLFMSVIITDQFRKTEKGEVQT